MANPLLMVVFAAAVTAVGNAAAASSLIDRPTLSISGFVISCDIRTASKPKPDKVASVLIKFLEAAPFDFPQVTKSLVDDPAFGAIILSWDTPPLPKVIDFAEITLLDVKTSGNILLAHPSRSIVTKKNGDAALGKDYVLSVLASFPENLASSGQSPKVLDQDAVTRDLKIRLGQNWPDVTCRIPPGNKKPPSGK
jgi:hypothetical protein